MIIEAEQALHAFAKHAGDFGVAARPNIPNFGTFLAALKSHVDDPSTVPIAGTYRNTIPAIHYYNATSGLWLCTNRSGSFIAGWRLHPSQVNDLLTNGNVR